MSTFDSDIHPHAVIGEQSEIGRFCVIHDQVSIGEGAVIGDHVVILPGTVIGSHVTIGSGSVIGKLPGANRKIKRKPQELSPLRIGNDVTIGALSVLYAGSEYADGVFVADHVSIRENVSIGENSVIGRSATIELNVRIGKNVIVQTGVYVTGDTIIEDEVFLGPCVSMSNDKYMGTQFFAYQGPTIKKGAAVGNNATLLPGIVIGERAMVGGGAVVTKDIPSRAIYVGNPAKAMVRSQSEEGDVS